MQFQQVRPGVNLGVLRTWIVTDEGRERVAITTQEGFAIIGDVIGPQGQDLSAALLALAGASAVPSIPPNPLSSQLTSPSVSQVGERPAADQPQIQSEPLAPSFSRQVDGDPASASQVATTAAPSPSVSAPTSAGATPPIQIAKAQSLDQLLEQAIDFSAWFSAGTPKPDAPVIYFVADPTCPHCATAVDLLATKIQSGDIDLRVILAPIRSQQAVYEAASILQSANPGADFMIHELSKTTSTSKKLNVLAPTEIQPDIVRVLKRNVEWMRANGIQGVPFWIYNTTAGARVEFGEVKDSMLADAIPARGSAQTAAQEAQR